MVNFSMVAAVICLIYGIYITVLSLRLSDRMADSREKCNKHALKANQGLVVLGGIMMAFSIGYIACQSLYGSCGQNRDFFWNNMTMFTLAIIGVSITVIVLSVIIENSDNCIDVRTTTQSMWIPSIMVLFIGLIMGYFRIAYTTTWGVKNLPSPG